MLLTENIRNYLHQHHLLSADGIILIALSGGADSVALLLLLNELGYNTRALHCNFHLRGQESDRDEAFVRHLCAKYAIQLEVAHFDTRRVAKERSISIEMAARDLRYEWFKEKRREYGAQAIAVAHHADDQAETLLLNLVRGTGLKGLAGMWPKNDYIVRPMLCCSRAEILNYLSIKQQDYVTDSTNLEREARRNQLRLDILPMLATINPNVNQAIANTATFVQQSIDYYRKGIQTALDELGATPTKFDIKRFVAAGSPPILLHEWLLDKGFNTAQEKEIIASIQGQPGAIYISPTHKLLRDRDMLICAENKPFTLSTSIINTQGTTQVADGITIEASLHTSTEELPRLPQYAWLDYDKLKFPLHIRLARPQDVFTPFGMHGRKYVSDFLTDNKATLFEKQQQLVVVSDTDIVWVVGRRTDDKYRINDSTKTILLLKVNNNNILR